MQVKEVMTREVQMIEADSTLREAAERMKDFAIGPLPVIDEDRLVGMVTDRDITVRGIAGGSNPASARVRDVMTQDVIHCFEDDDVRQAARLMGEKQVRRLVVLDRDKRLVGILSLGDLALETGDEHLTGHALEDISKPALAKTM